MSVVNGLKLTLRVGNSYDRRDSNVTTSSRCDRQNKLKCQT